MIGGGAIAALALALAAFELAWPVQLFAFTLLGFGFYLLHGSIQVQTTELSSTARGAAVSMHSFSFFVGHASGPVLYGASFGLVGAPATIAVAGVLILLIGLICARLLQRADARRSSALSFRGRSRSEAARNP